MSDKAAIIKEAQKYLARGQIDKAIAEWEKIVKESPDGNTYNTIGDLYLKKGDKTRSVDSFHKAARFFRDDGFSLKALALYKKILNIEPANTDAMYALGELSEEKGLATDAIKYYLASADILAKEGKKDALLKTYDKILNLSPSNISLRNKVAELFIKEGLQIEAAKEYLQIARVYEDKDDIANAETYYKKGLTLQPNSKEALLGLSSISEKTGDTKQSLEYIKKAADFAPDDIELSLKCAELLVKEEAYSDAIPFVQKVIESGQFNTEAKKLLGEIYLNEGDKQKAWEEYNAVIDSMIIEGKIDEAIDKLIAFIDIEPIEARKKLVSLYRQKGDSEAAFVELVYLGDNFVLSDTEMLKDALNCYREALQIHPDDASLKEKITDLERELGEEQAEQPEKPVEEALSEADTFLRYGLFDEARSLLENLKRRDPQNIDVHTKLKSLYTDIGDKELAVTECIILSELYNRAGNLELKEKFIKEAYEINPEDPRLLEKTFVRQPDNFVSEETPGMSIEDYSEDMSEAEFYLRQGLYEDAKAIYERLLKLFPDNETIKEKLVSIGMQPQEEPVSEEIVPEKILQKNISPKEKIATPVKQPEEVSEKAEEAAAAEEFVDLSTEEFMIPEAIEAFEAQEAPEPALENDVLDIFQEFKKGLEKELGTEDSETHYNLGIAYKEMGLIDDAIREFQVSKDDPKRFTQSINMLGICYMSKGLFPLAIEAFKSAIEKIDTKDEAFWGVKYDLAEAYEKNENLKEALQIYTDVYGWNSKFRNVSEKINLLKVMVAKRPEKPVISEKQKPKKERVSYL